MAKQSYQPLSTSSSCTHVPLLRPALPMGHRSSILGTLPPLTPSFCHLAPLECVWDVPQPSLHFPGHFIVIGPSYSHPTGPHIGHFKVLSSLSASHFTLVHLCRLGVSLSPSSSSDYYLIIISHTSSNARHYHLIITSHICLSSSSNHGYYHHIIAPHKRFCCHQFRDILSLSRLICAF